MIPVDLKNCDFFILDGSGANFISIRIGEGTLTYETKRNIVERKSRGNLFQLREGEEESMTVNFQFVWDFITSSNGENPTVEDVLYGRAGFISASARDPNGPFTVNLQIVNTVPCYGPTGGAERETHNFTEFAFQSLSHSLKDSTVDCKGICNRPVPTIIRG